MTCPTLAEIKESLRIAHVRATKGCVAARAGQFSYQCAPKDKAICEACKELAQ